MEKSHWSIHIEFAVLFITMLSGFFLIDARNERCMERIDRVYESSSQRSDKLYEMFYEVVKEGKK